jgi:hypothetical protein
MNQERRLELLGRTVEAIDRLGLGGLLRAPEQQASQERMIESLED